MAHLFRRGTFQYSPGCVEHTSALTHLIHEARTYHKDLPEICPDRANVYGCIAHQLILAIMQLYHITDHLIRNYFNNIHLRFWSKRLTTTSFKGFDIRVILFVMGMHMIIKVVEME